MEEGNKRKELEEVEDQDDSNDVGPKPKKKKALKFENLYINQLPSAELYEKSYMHRDAVTHLAWTKTDYLISASADGHVKFWKKQPKGIEFVKHFRAHQGPVVGLSTSADGTLLATCSSDKTVKVFDVINFDMINMFKVHFTPSTCEFIFRSGTAKSYLAISDKESGNIHIYDANINSEPLHTITFHKTSVTIIKYNPVFEIVVSCDMSGHVEYWDAQDYTFPGKKIEFQFKSATDLYEFAKNKTNVLDLQFSKDGNQFVTMGKDRQVRIFKLKTGKMFRKYDESLAYINKVQKEDEAGKLDGMEFGRRMTGEKEIDISAPRSSVTFDDSGNFIIYPTMLGIKIVNTYTNKVVKVLGKNESVRFLVLALYQGKTAGSATTENLTANAQYDPTLVCTAFKKNRFYLFTKRDPETNEDEVGRDVLNEKPTKEDIIAKPVTAKKLARKAIIHTTKGDIFLTLFPEECPKTVENFSVHSKNGYYNNVIFHRVIKSFMIQTGDPRGDGTGGESIWGGEFEDEFVRSLRHDKPFVLSMANAGPNTNGSQFFITTVPCPSLDYKHTVFGKVDRGFDVVQDIEKVETDKYDKPLDDIRIMNISVSFD